VWDIVVLVDSRRRDPVEHAADKPDDLQSSFVAVVAYHVPDVNTSCDL
jgi:hypothetical protein